MHDVDVELARVLTSKGVGLDEEDAVGGCDEAACGGLITVSVVGHDCVVFDHRVGAAEVRGKASEKIDFCWFGGFS